MKRDLVQLQKRLILLCEGITPADAAHDGAHSERVLANALRIAEEEGGDRYVLTAAAYLHDVANLPKDHPESHLSSERSAARAREWVETLGFTATQMELIEDAIICHSFSRGQQPLTLEGRIFQDADRLDSLGAVGLARVFTVGGALGRPLYSPEDPFHEGNRPLNDKQFTLDHFYAKLLKLPESFQTPAGRRLADSRARVLGDFLDQLRREINYVTRT